jgi:creatinine amidohydrolase
MMNSNKPKVHWSELLPWEFEVRQQACPIVYMPIGLCEPHGQVSALGLDTIKAEWLCQESARRCGGIVAPTVGYTIHESGFHARWLEDEVGEGKPYMTSMPPGIVLHYLLYQLRAFANTGFRGVVVVSGHSGGNQHDLRFAADRFSAATGVRVVVMSDPELVAGTFQGDHAGKYELSQLLYLRPDLVDFTRDMSGFAGSSTLGDASSQRRLALGADYCEATAAYGEQIMHQALDRLSDIVMETAGLLKGEAPLPQITYDQIENLWCDIVADRASWKSSSPRPGQQPVSPNSQWKEYEFG